MVSRVLWQKKYRRNSILSLLAGLGAFSFTLPISMAEDMPYSFNNFGGVGLLEMRTARFSPDGTVAVGVNYDNQEIRYFSTWQATPWLETTLSYSNDKQNNLGVDRSLDVKIRLWDEGNYRPQVAIGIQDALGTGRFGGEYLVASKRYYDFDFTMGFAWGYLGARGGVGNMFRLFGNSFDERSATTTSGGIRSGSFFSGRDMAFFAGAEYHPPIRGLSFKVEYSGVDRRKIALFSNVKRKSAFNVGINYKPAPWAEVALGFDEGERVGLRLTVKQNLHKLKFRKWYKDRGPAPILERRKAKKRAGIQIEVSATIEGNDIVFDYLRRLGATVIEVTQGPENIIFKVSVLNHNDADNLVLLGAILEKSDRVNLYIYDRNKKLIREYNTVKSDTIGQLAMEKFRKTAVYQRDIISAGNIAVAKEITAQGAYDKMQKADLSPISISVVNRKALVRKETGPFFSEAKNIGRTARILTRVMPDNVEEFTVISEENGITLSHVSLLRQDLEKANDYQGSPEEMWVNSKVTAPDKQIDADGENYKPQSGMTYNWGLKPYLLTHFGGNDDGRFRADIYAKLYGALQVNRHLVFSAELKQYIVGDIDQIPVDLTPNVPKVRSDIARYAKEGRTAIDRVQFTYSMQVDKNIYARFTGGLLESMYGGFGAEVLYRPYQHDFAVGVDLNWVKQRNFDQLFSFRNYNVVTGHATIYYENTRYNITSKLSGGRYLAGDYGATFDISRRFNNGIRIGVWATVTDMSSDDFGQGSFDKGIYLTMPLEIFWYQPSRDKMRFNFRSLGKNGGQMLDKSQSLYDTLSSGRLNRIEQEWQEILD